MIFPKALSKRHVIFLLLLITIDMVATMTWYILFDVGEANPILAGPINRGLAWFVITKLGMSLPGLLLLYRTISMRLSQVGLLILITWYTGIFFYHWHIFVELSSGSTIL